MKPRGVASWPSLAALFVAALVVVHRWSGDSPALWTDTLNDQYEVRRCVLEGSCSLVGLESSIPGVFVQAGWLAVRALLFRLGVGLSALHLVLQGLDALGVALVGLAGYRLGSRWLGAVAAFVLVHDLGLPGANRLVVYNYSPLPFLGAVLLLACVAAVERPGLLPAVLTGLLAAVIADMHAAGASLGVTVIWVALLAPGRRILRALTAGAVFAAAAFAIAPFAWIEGVRFFLRKGAEAARPPTPLAEVVAAVWHVPIAAGAALVLGAWLVCVAARRGSLRRALDVPVATTAPLFVLFVFALRHGVSHSGGRYLTHVKPAAALGIAAVVVGIASALVAEAPALLSKRAPQDSSLRPAVQWADRLAPRAARLLPWGARLAPWAAAAAIVHWAPSLPRAGGRFPPFTLRDVDAIARVLHDERGFTRDRVRHHVKAVEGEAMQTALLEETPGGFRDPPGPEAARAPDDDATDAIVMNLDPAELPAPLPPSWTIARRTHATAAVIVFTPSWLDWRRYELCGTSLDGWRCFHEGEPTCRTADHGRIALRVPLRTPPAAPGVPTHLFMPRLADLCGGRIVSVPGPASRLAPDGLHAILEGGVPGAVEIDWELSTPACPDAFSVVPHFFVEAAAADAATLEALLRRHEP